MWKVRSSFVDSLDGFHVYRVGDVYPHSGEADPSRIRELSGSNNRLGVALIEQVDEEPRKGNKKSAHKEV